MPWKFFGRFFSFWKKHTTKKKPELSHAPVSAKKPLEKFDLSKELFEQIQHRKWRLRVKKFHNRVLSAVLRTPSYSNFFSELEKKFVSGEISKKAAFDIASAKINEALLFVSQQLKKPAFGGHSKAIRKNLKRMRNPTLVDILGYDVFPFTSRIKYFDEEKNSDIQIDIFHAKILTFAVTKRSSGRE